MESFKVNILGCGSAKPTLRHYPTSQVVDFRGNLFMIDCGEGTQMQLMRMRLKPNRLRHIFISHLHGDHCYGLPGLLSTLGLTGINGHVTVHLPEEGIRLLKPLIDYSSHDLQVEFQPYEYGNNIIYEDKSLIVNTVPLKHRLPCVGFVFREKEKLRHINREMVDFHQVPVAMLPRIKAGEDYVKPDGTIVTNKILTNQADPSRTYAYISDTLPLKAVINEVKGRFTLSRSHFSQRYAKTGKRDVPHHGKRRCTHCIRGWRETACNRTFLITLHQRDAAA